MKTMFVLLLIVYSCLVIQKTYTLPARTFNLTFSYPLEVTTAYGAVNSPSTSYDRSGLGKAATAYVKPYDSTLYASSNTSDGKKYESYDKKQNVHVSSGQQQDEGERKAISKSPLVETPPAPTLTEKDATHDDLVEQPSIQVKPRCISLIQRIRASKYYTYPDWYYTQVSRDQWLTYCMQLAAAAGPPMSTGSIAVGSEPAAVAVVGKRRRRRSDSKFDSVSSFNTDIDDGDDRFPTAKPRQYYSGYGVGYPGYASAPPMAQTMPNADQQYEQLQAWCAVLMTTGTMPSPVY